MKRFIGGIFLIVCILTSHSSIIAILSSSSEYYGEYPPAGYQPEHGPILQEASSGSAAALANVRYWSHEPEDTYDHHFSVLSKTPLREKEEGAK